MALAVCTSSTDLHQKELLRHGDPAFPIACYEDDLDRITVPWHWHEEWELIQVKQGTVTVLLENTQFSIQVGDGLFINSGVLHAIDSQHSRGGMLRSAVFHPRLIGGSVESVFWNSLVLPLSNDHAPSYVLLYREDPVHKQILQDFRDAWMAMASEEEDYENRVRYLLSRAWRSLSSVCIKTASVLSQGERLDRERIRCMLTFIDGHITGELSTKMIAESVNLSESACLRCFHRMLRTTPIQYVKQMRLERAAELLRSTTMTAKEVAFACGFQDVSYFTKAFREWMGCTPKAYRNRVLR